MLTSTPATWTVRGATFVLWALAAASAVAWGLKLGGSGRVPAIPAPPPRTVAAADPETLARLLGGSPAAVSVVAAPAAPALASRLQLVGVAAGARSGGGAAVLAVDGKPARSYRVGSSIEEGLVLQSVRGREATLVQADGTSLTLQVPEPTLSTATPPPPPVPAPARPVFGRPPGR